MFPNIDDPHKMTVFIRREDMSKEAEKSIVGDANRRDSMDKPYRKIKVAARIRYPVTLPIFICSALITPIF